MVKHPLSIEGVADRILAGDVIVGKEDLYKAIMTRRWWTYKRVGEDDFMDVLNETFVLVCGAIESGELRDPKCLIGYIQTILWRQIIDRVKGRMKRRSQPSVNELILPDPQTRFDEAIERSDTKNFQKEMIRVATQEFSKSRKDLFQRYFIDGEKKEKTMEECHMTETQYRLSKSRMKQALVAQLRHAYARDPVLPKATTTNLC